MTCQGRWHHFSSVQSLSRVRLFATPWTDACQASLSITSSQNLLKLMSIKSVMPSNCHPLSSPFADLDLCIRGPHTQPLSPSCFMTWPQNCSDPATGVLGVGLDGVPHLLAPLPAFGLWDMYASLSWGPRIPTLSLASSCMSCLQWGPGLREPPVSSGPAWRTTRSPNE